MAYDYKKYALAIDMLQEELAQSYDIEKHFLLADAYNKLNETEKALDIYGRLIDASTPATHLLDYAFTLKRAQRYSEAADVFRMLKTESRLDVLLDQEISACQKALYWINNPDSLTALKSLIVNSKAADYHPVVIDGRLIFTSDRSYESSDEYYDWTGRSFSNIWESDLNGTNASPLGQNINSTHNEGTPVLSPDRTTMYFTRCYSEEAGDAFCHIMSMQRIKEKWNDAVKVPNINGTYNTSHPVISSSGELMFFASDKDGGYGGKDLYYSRLQDGAWSTPINLGQRINGEGDEVFPHLYFDTLYFASTSHPGLGGLDIFYSYFDNEGQWVSPINLGTPLNSGEDDFGIFIDTTNLQPNIKLQGYFSSSRKDGMGADDIYGFTTYHPESEIEKDTIPLLLTVKVVKPIYRETMNPNSGVKRYVPVDSSTIRINDITYITDITGTITHKVDSGGFYRITANAKDLLSSSAIFTADEDLENGLGYVRLVLTPLLYNTEIVLNNIYYDFEKWNIRADARPSLDSLISILKNNTDISIQLGSHTDCRGEDLFNLDLSQKRANAAVQYMIANGILPERLTAKGYGETKPFVQCICADCTEEEHQLNRRTSFTIIR